MRKPSPPEPVLLFIATLYHDEEYFSAARQGLCACFGETIIESHPLPWEHSHYYREELGSPITRRFLFFRNMVDRETLSDIKLATIEMEGRLSTGEKRNVNLDPGYLTPYNVVLASTKNYSHRIYIGKGIFAEVTLVYKDKDRRYQPHLFTYRDYASDAYAQIFAQARTLLR
jgi:hypothetical protein